MLGDVAGDMELPKPGPVRPAAAPFAALWFVDYAFAKVPHFRYVERGAMASMGMGGGILDLGKAQQGAPGITGVAAAAVWKGAYWTKQLSWANMMLIPMYWFKTRCSGGTSAGSSALAVHIFDSASAIAELFARAAGVTVPTSAMTMSDAATSEPEKKPEDERRTTRRKRRTTARRKRRRRSTSSSASSSRS